MRLALRRLRRGGSLRCAVRSVAAPVAGLPSSWLDGAATLTPGRFVLDTRAGERVDLVVGTVVETTARTHRDRGLGPNRLGICQLRTPAGTVLWAAHPALLAAGAAVLRDEA